MPACFACFGREVAADGLGLVVHLIERDAEATHAGEAGVMVIGLRHVFDGMGTDLNALSNLTRAVQLGLRTRQLPFP